MQSEADYPQTIAAARVGAEWAWASIYRDLSPSVLRYLRAHGAAEPEDLLGEVFVKVVRSFERFDGDGRDLRAWVFTIARNALVDHRRELGRLREDPSDPSEIPEGSGPGADGDVLARLADERVRVVVAGLSDAQRDVVYLRVIAGFSIEEVARVTGRTPGAVKSLQARGLATIRRKISRLPVSSDPLSAL